MPPLSQLCALVLFIFFTKTEAQTHRPQEFLKSISGTKTEGLSIYQHYCSDCHAQKPLIPLGAPKKGDQKDWELRMQQNINQLFQHINEGLNAMPPRGGCFECTDEQLFLATAELIPQKDKQRFLNEGKH